MKKKIIIINKPIDCLIIDDDDDNDNLDPNNKLDFCCLSILL